MDHRTHHQYSNWGWLACVRGLVRQIIRFRLPSLNYWTGCLESTLLTRSRNGCFQPWSLKCPPIIVSDELATTVSLVTWLPWPSTWRLSLLLELSLALLPLTRPLGLLWCFWGCINHILLVSQLYFHLESERIIDIGMTIFQQQIFYRRLWFPLRFCKKANSQSFPSRTFCFSHSLSFF